MISYAAQYMTPFLDRNMLVILTVLTVIVIRFGIRKLPKRYSYALWGIVGIRMLFDIEIRSPLSILNLFELAGSRQDGGAAGRILRLKGAAGPALRAEYLGQNGLFRNIVAGSADAVSGGSSLSESVNAVSQNLFTENLFSENADLISRHLLTGAGDVVSQNIQGMGLAETAGQAMARTAAGSALQLSAGEWFSLIWICGVVILFLYAICSYIRVRRRVAFATPMKDMPGVYESDRVHTAFILGIFAPRIYVPYGMGEQERAYILCHERYHIHRKDTWFKAAAFVLLCLYWCNPAAWLAFYLFSLDMEMSCDEAVLSQMGMDIKKGYSLSLLSLAAGRNYWRAVPLGFGESDAGKRIRHVLDFRKPKVWMHLAAVAVIAAAIPVCLTKAAGAAEAAVTADAADLAAAGDVTDLADFTGAADMENTADTTDLTGMADAVGMTGTAGMVYTADTSTALHRNINANVRQVGPAGNVAATNQGLYFAESFFAGGQTGERLLYFDSHTGETYVVCTDPDCTHDTAACDAVYMLDSRTGGQMKISPLGVYENQLYVLGSILKGSSLCLYRSDLDGQNRELLWQGTYESSNPDVLDRMITAGSVLWNGSQVFVEYYAEDQVHLEKETVNEETGETEVISREFTTHGENGILSMDVRDNPEPVRVCEESSRFVWIEAGSDGKEYLEMFNDGYACMMAVRDGSVYYRHLRSDELPDWEEYPPEEGAMLLEQWSQYFTGQIVEASVQGAEVTERTILELDPEMTGRSAYDREMIYYEDSAAIWEYDLLTGQTGELMPLEGGVLEDVIDGWVICRNYGTETILLYNLETGETVTKEMPLGDNLYGSVTLNGRAYWFMRSTDQEEAGGRIYRWYLVEREEYLTEEEPERIVVAEFPS